MSIYIKSLIDQENKQFMIYQKDNYLLRFFFSEIKSKIMTHTSFRVRQYRTMVVEVSLSNFFHINIAFGRFTKI